MVYQFDKWIDSSRLQEELHNVGIEVDHIDTNDIHVEIYINGGVDVSLLNSTVAAHVKDLPPSLDDEAEKRMDFGTVLFKDVSKKVWVINTEAELAGNPLTIPQMQSLLSTSDQLQKALESGSFKTAKYVAGVLKTSLPVYAAVADYAIAEINSYLGL